MIRKATGLLTVMAAITLNVAAQKTQAPMKIKGNMAVIEGAVTRSYVKNVKLYRAYEGNYKELASAVLDEKGNYAFAVPDPKEGFYYISDCLGGGREISTRVYLKPGTSMILNLKDNSYEMITKSEENIALDKWQQFDTVITKPAYQFWSDRVGYTGVFPVIEAFTPKVAAFKKQLKTKNEKFNNLMDFVVDDDVEAAALNFLATPRVKHPDSTTVYPAIYATIKQDKKYCDARILELGDGARRVSMYASYCQRKDKVSYKDFGYGVNLFCNDSVKGAFIVYNLRGFKTFDDLQKTVVEPYSKYLVTDSMKSKVALFQKTLATLATGEKAIDFSFPDLNGKNVSMKDLKGKVVLVDVWATWCGPCRGELPHLQKLEDELKDKNIAFISMSTDVEKDKEKWKNMIAEKQMGGIQLFTNGPNNVFSEYYKVNTIPRFLVFDQEGKIVSSDAPRPSEPALKDLLLKTLNK